MNTVGIRWQLWLGGTIVAASLGLSIVLVAALQPRNAADGPAPATGATPAAEATCIPASSVDVAPGLTPEIAGESVAECRARKQRAAEAVLLGEATDPQTLEQAWSLLRRADGDFEVRAHILRGLADNPRPEAEEMLAVVAACDTGILGEQSREYAARRGLNVAELASSSTRTW